MSIPLCSQCAKHELTSWINENLFSLDEDITKQIREEIKDIRLKPGRCIVCNSASVSNGFLESSLKILEKYKADSKLIEDFKKSFLVESSEAFNNPAQIS